MLTTIVSSFTALSSGFQVRLNRAINPNLLNLYDTQTGGLGAADVTLTGAATGPVAGSLVVDTTNQLVTFLKTGGPLAPDDYTVALRSATDGFRGNDGTLLDGNADGTAGDNYTTTFTVASTSARVVSVPDFAARTGGRCADLGVWPASALSDGTGVTSVQLTLWYNPQLLTISGANLPAGLPTGASVTRSTPATPAAVLTFTSPTALSAGQVTFASLTA